MAIQISGTTVIDNSRNLTNIVSYGGPGVATQAEAESGTNNDQLMTPLRVKQAIDALSGGSVINRIQRGSTNVTGSAGNRPWLSNTPSYVRGTANAPITSVNTGKAFVSSSETGSGAITPTNQPGTLSGGAAAALTSATNVALYAPAGIAGVTGYPIPLAINSPSTTAGQFTVEWEVIEFT